MPAVSLTPADLAPFATIETAKAEALIEDAVARAARIAPCIRDAELSQDHAAAAKAILRGAILRRNEAGSGAATMQAAGPFSQQVDTRSTSRVLLFPSEISELEGICRDHNGDSTSGAYTVDMAGGTFLDQHADWCALNFGANYCDCGANIAGYPIFGEPS